MDFAAAVFGVKSSVARRWSSDNSRGDKKQVSGSGFGFQEMVCTRLARRFRKFDVKFETNLTPDSNTFLN